MLKQVLFVCFGALVGAAPAAPPVDPAPPARTADVTDDYFGTKVRDPYRWMEDVNTPQVQSYARAQNERLRHFVDGPRREAIRERLGELINYPRVTLPARHGTDERFRYIVHRNSGLQNQDVLYVRDGLDAPERMLIDPNTLSADGTIALNSTEFTVDGHLLAYGLSSGGSDQQEIHLRDVDSGKDLPDVLKWCRFSTVAWTRDNAGFFYNRYPTPGTVPPLEETLHNRVYYHKLGTPQDQDPPVYERNDDKEMEFQPGITEDGRYLILAISHGTSPNTRIYYRPADAKGDLWHGDFVKLLDAEDARYDVIENVGSTLYLFTNKDAPRGRIIAIDPAQPGEWKQIIPQGTDVIDEARIIHDQLVTVQMHDAHHLIRIYSLDGKPEREIELPELGSVIGLSGFKHDRQMLYGFTSFSRPPTSYLYDFASGKSTVYAAPRPPFDPSVFQTEQVFYTSKDGTKVPMFVVHKKGLKLDGSAPAILYAYGGFAINTLPRFSPTRAFWLEHGGIFAIANIRGGAEYGESWHDAAIVLNRQKCFDDFEAAAEDLVAHRYTSTNRLASEGGSNGGLLVSTCYTQRPDLFGAVLCHVPVTDMLRYPRMGIGHFWVPEYGDALTDEKTFRALYAYSPLHNVKAGQLYPPILITTGDGDDRVVPAHPLKLCATLQAKADPRSIVLLRYETRAGHGGGKPITKVLDETADGYAFLAKVFGLDF